MTDYFALLDEPRRLWIDTERLRTKFLSRSAQVHPDKIHAATAAERETANRSFAELNAAFNCLRNPRARLRHLLELELGTRPKEVQEIPPDLAEWFGEIARLRREVNSFLAESARIQSALLRVQRFERAQEWVDRLRAAQKRLGDHTAGLLSELQALDAEWICSGNDPVQRGVLLRKVEQILQRVSFYSRWDAQIQETIVQLTI